MPSAQCRMGALPRGLMAAAGAATLGYAGYAALTWLRYGAPRRPDVAAGDDALDRFMPAWEAGETHQVEINAPAAATYAAGRAMDLNRSMLVRGIFAARNIPAALLLKSAPRQPSRTLLSETLALGWRILAEEPDRILVVGAVTQPWKPSPVFRGIAPEEFAGFAEPGYAKIVWTVEAVPIGDTRSLFRTRTRVSTTDAFARRRFRRYWAVVSPGVGLIRRQSLGIVRRDAERRWSAIQAEARLPAAVSA